MHRSGHRSGSARRRHKGGTGAAAGNVRDRIMSDTASVGAAGPTGISPAAGIGGFIAHYAQTRPDAPAIVHRGVAVTWRVLAANVLATMDELQAAGMRSGQVL